MLQVHGTPLSHFTRKVRVVLAELGVAHEMVWLPGVLAPAPFAGNPLMRVPALVDGAEQIYDSDHIARYVIGRFDPADRLAVRSEAVADLNRLAAISGIMANEVTLILAQRAGGVDLATPYFGKLRAAIDRALGWLDERVAPDAAFDYRDIALVCMWQHLAHYRFVEDLDRHRALADRVAHLAARPALASTAPQAALAEAAAAGWVAG